MVIDANALLKAFFPDEEGHLSAQAIISAYAQGRVNLWALALLSYEVTNAVLKAIRRERLSLENGRELLDIFRELGIPAAEPSWQRTLELAHTFQLSAYDGSYLALAEETGEELVTGDRRLYDAVKEHLPWVRWVDDVAF